MRKRFLTLILISISLLSFGQDKMMQKAETAFEYYENGEKLKAVEIFKNLVKDYPSSEHYGRNLYNIPSIYQELDSTELAVKWFLKVIGDKKLDDTKEDHSRGIFETNTNFKHYSAMNIGAINFNHGNYREALKYYKLADTAYPYYNTSGTDIKLNKIQLASNISDSYIKLERVDSAIVVLLPQALTESPRANNNLTDKVFQILKENGKENDFKKELEKGLADIKQIKGGIEISVYGIKVKIYPYFDEELTYDYFRKTDLYKKLN